MIHRYWHTCTIIPHVGAVVMINVGLAQAHPNYKLCVLTVNLYLYTWHYNYSNKCSIFNIMLYSMFYAHWNYTILRLTYTFYRLRGCELDSGAGVHLVKILTHLKNLEQLEWVLFFYQKHFRCTCLIPKRKPLGGSGLLAQQQSTFSNFTVCLKTARLFLIFCPLDFYLFPFLLSCFHLENDNSY